MLFFFNDTATTEIYTLSLHDALPILLDVLAHPQTRVVTLTVTEKGYCHDPATGALNENHPDVVHDLAYQRSPDRKSTRLNSSHANISYAVFCLKKKNNNMSLFYIQSS